MNNDKKYIKPGDPILPGESSEEKSETLLFFTIYWLKIAIKIGTDLLSTHKKINQLSKEEWSKSAQYSYEKLDPVFKEIALSLKELGMHSELKGKYNWPDNIILDHISLNLRCNEKESFANNFFFLHSMNQAIRFLNKLIKFYPKIKDEFKKFKKENEFLPEVRNIYEHNDEYVLGKGRKQDKNFVLNKERSSLSDATGVYIYIDKENGELEIVIGNRVYVRKSVNSAKKIIVSVIMICNKIDTYIS